MRTGLFCRATLVGAVALLALAPADRSASAQAPAPRLPTDRKAPVTIDADRMERFGKEGLVVFSGSVVARQTSAVQYADRMEVYFDEKGERLMRTVSTGTVKIVTQDCRTATARRAEYFDLEQRVLLSGNARVWQDENLVTGETIEIFLDQDRAVVHRGREDRVKAVFVPRNDQRQGGERKENPVRKATCDN